VATASRILPADILQKLILLAIFVLACSGAAALLDREPLLARLAAGIFYAWNPYVAERVIIGQWALLLGYAGLPWVLRAVLAPDLESRRGAGRLALALLPAIIGGFAGMAITALVAVPAALFTKSTRRAAVVLAALAAGSLPWLIPSLVHAVYVDPLSVAAFATRADTPFGSIGSLLMLGGAWNAQTVPRVYGGPWSVLWLAAVLVALAGYLAIARRHALAGGSGPAATGGQGSRVVPPGHALAGGSGPAATGGQGSRVVPPGHALAGGSGGVVPPGQHRWPGLGVAALAGLIIAAVGVTAVGRDLLRSLIAAWPAFAILRDAQQFVAPLALAEACGFGLAVAAALDPVPTGQNVLSLERPIRANVAGTEVSHAKAGRPARTAAAGTVLAVLALLAPVVLLPGLAWGAAGRLRSAWYPAAWLAAARSLDASPARGSVLLLPWATYRTPLWNHGEVLLDPWTRLLSRPLIWNDGTEVGSVALIPDDSRARRLDAAIDGTGPLTATLRAAGVRFVLDDANGPGTQVASRLPGSVVIINLPGLTVYQLPT
jgi:hypothetical protein